MATGSNLTPGAWPIVRVRGDTMIPERFTLTVDGEPLVFTSAVAQVRKGSGRSSTLVMELSVDIVSNVVTVGDGDIVADDVGSWYWDLQGTNTDYPSGFTVLGGAFRILDDVSEAA